MARRRWRVLLPLATLAVAIGAATVARGEFGFLRQFGTEGTGGEAGLAVDRAGATIYSADPSGGRVFKYAPDGRQLGTITGLTRPYGLAVDSAGNLYVMQAGSARVQVFSSAGAPLRTIAPTGDDALDDLAAGIATDRADNLYVADLRHARILVLSATGTPLRRIPTGGPWPGDVAVDANGNVYALIIDGDAGCTKNRVMVFRPDGTPGPVWSVVQGQAYGCARFGIAVDPKTGEILVSTQGGTQPGVRRYTPAGQPVGTPILGDGTPGSTLPSSGVAVDPQGTVYVRNSSSGRVLAFGEKPATPTAPGGATGPAPNLQNTIPSPQTITKGPATVVAPGKVSLRSLKRSRCVRTLVVSTKPARVLVAIYSGRRSIRLFGQKLVRFVAPGKRVACIPVPFRAHTFDARTGLRIAVGVALGSVARRGGPQPTAPPSAGKPIRLLP